MILKIIGAAIVVLSSAILGFYYSYKEVYRINDLNEIKKALTILKSEIEFNLTALPEAMLNISKRVKEPIKTILMDFSEKLINKDERTVNEIWFDVIKANKKNTYFNNEDFEIFNSFGKTLGYLDRIMQINSINMVIDYIDQKVEMLNKISVKNKKMYQSLGVLGGLIIIIILV